MFASVQHFLARKDKQEPQKNMNVCPDIFSNSFLVLIFSLHQNTEDSFSSSSSFPDAIESKLKLTSTTYNTTGLFSKSCRHVKAVYTQASILFGALSHLQLLFSLRARFVYVFLFHLMFHSFRFSCRKRSRNLGSSIHMALG